MSATIVPENNLHYPVLLKEVLSIISPQNGGTFIDCTFGQGGYSRKILQFPKTKVIAFDRDQNSKLIADGLKKRFQNRFQFYNKKFSEIDVIKTTDQIKGIIFDLGFSYNQIKDPSKGLSFNYKGKLNMKMGQNKFSAQDVIKYLSAHELEKIFKYFGEEKEAKRIATRIVKERKDKIIDTQSLVEIIEKTKKKKNFKIHSATKVFQALRIFVNREISELINGLVEATKILKKDGILVVVTFHSLEDKIVKYFFKSLSEKKSISRYFPKISQPDTLFDMVQKKPIIPSSKELQENISSRSAKLRYALKKKDFYNFKTDIFKKFNYLIEIENFGDKL